MRKNKENLNEELHSDVEKENIEDIFSNKKIKKTIIIAKIKSIFKIAVVFFVCLVITRFGNYYYLEYLDDKIVRQNTYYINISSPNIEFTGTSSQIGFFSGQAITGYNKYVNGVRVSLGGVKYNYGFLNKNNGKFEYTVDILPRLPENHKDIEEKTVYNGLGHRLMKFYHPKASFKKYNSDLNLLDELEDSKNIEMALSFDRDYSISEVQKLIPENIDLGWYWVDTFNKEDIIKMNAVNNPNRILLETSDEMVGFKGSNSSNIRYEEPERGFISNLQYLDKEYRDKYKNIFEILEDSNGNIDAEKIRIIGVVVTGNKESLSTLRDKQWIKSSSFGVIVDKF